MRTSTQVPTIYDLRLEMDRVVTIIGFPGSPCNSHSHCSLRGQEVELFFGS